MNIKTICVKCFSQSKSPNVSHLFDITVSFLTIVNVVKSNKLNQTNYGNKKQREKIAPNLIYI